MKDQPDSGHLNELEIHPLKPSDVAQCLRLSDEAGWNQSQDDWLLLLGGVGFGFFHRKHQDRRLVASAILFPYPPTFAWVSMVLVQESWRRNGLATSLMSRCIEEARKRRLTLFLDATEAGRSVYRNLGFDDCYSITRLERANNAVAETSATDRHSGTVAAKLADRVSPSKPHFDSPIRPIDPADVIALADWDAHHFGTSRQQVLESVYQQSPTRSGIALRPTSQIDGYSLCRDGRLAQQIGPVVALTEGVARNLIAQVLISIDNDSSNSKRGITIIDVPDEHQELQAWLGSVGFVARRQFMRMQLGGEGPAELSRSCFAVGGPEIG